MAAGADEAEALIKLVAMLIAETAAGLPPRQKPLASPRGEPRAEPLEKGLI